LVIDTRLADDRHYPRQMTDQIAAATGVRIDLSQMRAAEPRMALSRFVQARIEHSALQIFPRAVLPKTPIIAQRAAALSPRLGDRLAASF
jgi:hypothetical protein